MADISKYLNEILEAIYGEEVRGSIVNALRAQNSETETNTATTTELADGWAEKMKSINDAITTASSAAETADKAAESASAAAGTGIKSTVVEYQAGDSGTTAPDGNWSENIPHVESGHYLWTRIRIVYNDGSENVFYSVSKMGSETGIDFDYDSQNKKLIIVA